MSCLLNCFLFSCLFGRKARNERKADAKAKVKADAKAKVKADAEAKVKADADAKAKVKADADAKAKVKADAEAKSTKDKLMLDNPFEYIYKYYPNLVSLDPEYVEWVYIDDKMCPTLQSIYDPQFFINVYTTPFPRARRTPFTQEFLSAYREIGYIHIQPSAIYNYGYFVRVHYEDVFKILWPNQPVCTLEVFWKYLLANPQMIDIVYNCACEILIDRSRLQD